MDESDILSSLTYVNPSPSSASRHLAFKEPLEDRYNANSPPIPSSNYRPRRQSILSSGSRSNRLSFCSDYNTYHRRVSFDNIANLPPAAQSFTLKHKSQGFERRANARTFLVAVDLDEGTSDPIQFVVHSLMDDGDELVVVGACTDSDRTYASISHRQKANEIMNHVIDIHRRDDKISIIVELVFAKAETALHNMIDLYQPSLVVTGNRVKQLPFTHVFSGTGIFRAALKHTRTPVLLVRDHVYSLRRQSTSDAVDTSSTEDKHTDNMPTRSVSAPTPRSTPSEQSSRNSVMTSIRSTLFSCFNK